MNFYYLPKVYHNIHQMCFELVCQVEEFLTKEEYRFLQVTTFSLKESELANFKNGQVDVWDYLKEYNPKGFRVQLNKTIILGLIKDFCYFMQESLDCSNKMRLVVAYSLLRRPLVYNMTILLRLLYDDKFYDNFINRDDYDPAKIDDLVRKYLDNTDNIRITKTISGAFIYDCIFNKVNLGSIINMSNRAIHPVTTRPWNKTGEMNFNFMFTTHEDTEDLWKHYYAYLPAILLFYVDLFNITIFGLFKSEINHELFNKRMEAIVNIMKRGFAS